MNKIFVVKYPGSWMGGNAVVVAETAKEAWEMLEENNVNMDSFDKCKFIEVPYSPGVLYNWDGEY